MEIKIFKPGDKVILTDQGKPIGWERKDFTIYLDIIEGQECTIKKYEQLGY